MPQLSPSQKIAVETTEGPVLIIAGPGSGKTRTLVERIIRLIQRGVKSEAILVATFTEKAAKELLTRISNRLLELEIAANLHEMYIGTLHSIFLRFLEENRTQTRLKRNYRLLDQFDQKYLIFNRINEYLKIEDASELLGDYKVPNWTKAEKIVKYVNAVGEECIEHQSLLDSNEPGIQVMGRFAQLYEKQLEEENALDFTTIQVEVLQLLENYPEVLREIQAKIAYFMIDEYQDTNTIQERIVLLISNRQHNLCVVGDDDQGLYRFRGATIRNILEFEDNFPKGSCTVVRIETNYRSHPHIVSIYNRWMSDFDWTKDGKTFRHDKLIRAREGSFPEVPAVVKVASDGELEDYYAEVLRFIRALEHSGKLTDYNQIAFLFRSVKNEKVVGLAAYLEKNGINVFSPRSALYFEREEVQLLLGALIFVFPNLLDTLKWSDDARLEVWDYYESCFAKFSDALRADLEEHADLLKWAREKAKAHLSMEKKTNYGFAGLVYQLLEFSMFSHYLDADLNDNKSELRASFNLALMTRLLNKFEYLNNAEILTPKNKDFLLRELFNKFFRFIYLGGIEEYEDFDEYAPSGCVSFLTIHQSKGLEFPITVVGSLQTTPRKQYSDIDEIFQNNYLLKPPFEPIEETKNYDFKRLFYTAFSRPQNLLVLTAQEQFNKKGGYKNPSKHFASIYKELPKWDPFQLSAFAFEEVKPTNIKKEYSFTSHILLYESCPLQYKYYKEFEFVEVRKGGVIGGTLLHQTIEDIHKKALEGQTEQITDENIENWFNTNYELLVMQQRTHLHKGQRLALLRQILHYKKRNNNNWDHIREAEVDVSLVKDDYILKGTIDLVEGEGNTLELVDFKSGPKPDVNSRNKKVKQTLRQYQRQLEVYAHIIEERTEHTISKLNLYYPKEEEGNPKITFLRNQSNMEETVASFGETVKKIENKNFSMEGVTKDEKHCRECDLRFHCKAAV